MSHADRARTFFEREYYTPAIDAALLAAAEAEGDAQTEMRALAAIALQRKNQSLAAIAALDEVLEANPDHSRALAARGAAHDRLGRPQRARDDLARAVELDPDHAPAWISLAFVLYDAGDDEGFGRAIENLERLGEMTGYIYRLRGARRLEAGDRDGGGADLRAGCKNGDPMSAFQLREAGFELESGADHALWGLDRAKRRLADEAIAAYQKAVELGFEDPERDARVTRNLAQLLADRGDTEAALAAVTALTERSPDRADSWLTRGRFDGETVSFERAHELDPEQAALPLARHHLGAGRLDEALALCTRRLEQDADDIDALLVLANVHRAADRADKAKEAYLAAEALGSFEARRARVAAFGPERGLDHFDAALDLLDKQRRSDAVAEFETAIDLLRGETRVPGDEASRCLAKSLHNSAFLRELKVDDSIIEPNLREALEIDPTYTDVMLNLANLCLRTDRVDEGLEWFARAGELDPTAGQGWFYRARHFAGLGDHQRVLDDATRAYEAYSRRGQHRFAGDAAMLRGQSNEALDNLLDARRDYDLAYDCGHPTGYAMGDNIRTRIALEIGRARAPLRVDRRGPRGLPDHRPRRPRHPRADAGGLDLGPGAIRRRDHLAARRRGGPRRVRGPRRDPPRRPLEPARDRGPLAPRRRRRRLQ
jgi:tetratricopeptide (TPR) repeat protein